MIEVPKKMPEYEYFEQNIVPLLGEHLSATYNDFVAALPDLMNVAIRNSPLTPKDKKRYLRIFVFWMEFVSWNHSFGQPECDSEGNRIPKPWEGDRIMNRMLRFGSRGVSVSPVLTKNPDKYKVRKFNDAVDFHLLWSSSKTDILANIRAAFDSYTNRKKD